MAQFNSNFEAILSLISAGSTLSATLTAGNTTSDNALIVSNPVGSPNARLQGEDDAIANATASGNLIVRAGDKTAGTGDGGDLLLFAGTSLGGVDGIINITGDTTFVDNVTITGTLTTGLSFSGAGTPEGSQVAPVGSTYHRTTPTSLGNAFYVKLSGVGNTGWAPVGPRVNENFIASGSSASFALTSSDTFYRNVAGVPDIDICVYWNGVRLTYGPSNDFTVSATLPVVPPFTNTVDILDGFGNPLIPLAGDRIVIDYLPA